MIKLKPKRLKGKNRGQNIELYFIIYSSCLGPT